MPDDTADWKAALTVTVAGWVDSATIVTQVVRVSTRASSTRPQAAVRRLIAEAAASEVVARSSIKWISLYIVISICRPCGTRACPHIIHRNTILD